MSFQKVAVLLVLLNFFIAACSSGNKQATSTSVVETVKLSSASKPQKLSIQHIQMRVAESFPIQVNAIIQGRLLDSCTELDQFDVEKQSDTFIIVLKTRQRADANCHPTARPFERIIPLEVKGLRAGVYTVKSTDKTAIFELAVDNIVN